MPAAARQIAQEARSGSIAQIVEWASGAWCEDDQPAGPHGFGSTSATGRAVEAAALGCMVDRSDARAFALGRSRYGDEDAETVQHAIAGLHQTHRSTIHAWIASGCPGEALEAQAGPCSVQTHDAEACGFQGCWAGWPTYYYQKGEKGRKGFTSDAWPISATNHPRDAAMHTKRRKQLQAALWALEAAVAGRLQGWVVEGPEAGGQGGAMGDQRTPPPPSTPGVGGCRF